MCVRTCVHVCVHVCCACVLCVLCVCVSVCAFRLHWHCRVRHGHRRGVAGSRVGDHALTNAVVTAGTLSLMSCLCIEPAASCCYRRQRDTSLLLLLLLLLLRCLLLLRSFVPSLLHPCVPLLLLYFARCHALLWCGVQDGVSSGVTPGQGAGTAAVGFAIQQRSPASSEVAGKALNNSVVSDLQNQLRNSLHNLSMCAQSITDVREARLMSVWVSTVVGL